MANTARRKRRREEGILGGGVEGQERVGENINQCGMGVWLSGSTLSAQQIGKHFNGFLSTAPLTTLSGSIACTLVMPQ